MKKVIALILSIAFVLSISIPSAALLSIPVNSIRVSSSKISLNVGQSTNLKVAFTPANTTQKKLTYSTANKFIAKVDSVGKITAVKSGTTTVTVYTVNKQVYAKCTVTVSSVGPVKLTIGVPSTPLIQDYATNLQTKTIENLFNVKFKFTMLPPAPDTKTKFSLMVASGEVLPDILNVAIDDTYAYDFASKGIFKPVDNYYKSASTAPNFYKIAKTDRDFLLANLKLADGKIYSLPNYQLNPWNEGAYRFWMNGDWLTKLNLKVPTTTDELYDVLKAFVTKDPNGNGKKDEIGMVGSPLGWATNVIPYLMNAFISANPDKGYFSVKNGKIISSFTQPEWKQGLEYINKLIKDDLLSTLSFTQDMTQLKTLINVKGGVAGAVSAGSYSTFSLNELGWSMVLTAPVKGPKGVKLTVRNPSLPSNYWFITKDCKNPEFAFKVGDYFLGTDGSFMSRYGENGKEWTDDSAIISQYIEPYEAEGIKPRVAILDIKFWGNPQNKSWITWSPFYFTEEQVKWSTQFKKVDPAPVNFNPQYNKEYATAFPKETIAKLPFTPAELKNISNIKVAIDKYVADTTIAFVTGNKPLSQWDSYLTELQNMGLKEYTAITQAAFDRAK